MTPTSLSRFRGCLLGGALGDSLGAAVEFLSGAQIEARFGVQGPASLEPAYGRRGAITDDTQMTLFTAEGLIRAEARWTERGVCHPAAVVFNSYQRWLLTQGESSPTTDAWRDGPDGWLVSLPELHSRRAPGLTCLGALRSGAMGTVEAPLNDSKGCGGVMRVAPVGLVAKDAFALGVEVAALTHGHPSGYLSSGYLAYLIQALRRGEDDLEAACRSALEELRGHPGAEECATLVSRALELARAGEPSRERLSALGTGWVGEEALAMALYCALVADDFVHGVRFAVNHSGDSDSTGAICGNVLGALWGEEALPRDWLAELELRDEIATLADDLHAYTRDEIYVSEGGGRDEQGRIRVPYASRSPEQALRYPAW